MKTLILVRHGEAADIAESDSKRPLTDEGKTKVEIGAELLMAHQLIPDVILCSAALRTRETCQIISHKLQVNSERIQYFNKFYSQGYDTYVDEILALNDSINTAMIVGHNPAISELANYCSQDEIVHLNTGGIIVFSFNINEWNLIFFTPSKITVRNFS